MSILKKLIEDNKFENISTVYRSLRNSERL